MRRCPLWLGYNIWISCLNFSATLERSLFPPAGSCRSLAGSSFNSESKHKKLYSNSMCEWQYEWNTFWNSFIDSLNKAHKTLQHGICPAEQNHLCYATLTECDVPCSVAPSIIMVHMCKTTSQHSHPDHFKGPDQLLLLSHIIWIQCFQQWWKVNLLKYCT